MEHSGISFGNQIQGTDHFFKYDNMSKSRILIIDDEVDICKLVSGFLRTLSYDVKYANTLQEGREQLEDFKPDILFLDLNLPDGSGMSLVPFVKRNFPATRIIVISAYDNYVEKNRLKKDEVDYFIPKPFNLSLIKSTLSSLADKSENKTENPVGEA